MQGNCWLQKWEKNEIGFHESEANPLLVEHFKELSLAKGSRIFLPLCGKTLDIAWTNRCYLRQSRSNCPTKKDAP